MNLNHTKYQLINNLREPSFMFWTIFYPLLMALMFYTAFQGLIKPEPMEIPVAVEIGSPAAQVFRGIEILKPVETDAVEGLRLLSEQKVTGFVAADLTVRVRESGIKETVLASIVSQMVQMEALKVPYSSYDFSASYIQAAPARYNPFLIPFYSLIGMVSLYSVYMGLELSRILQADQSMEALRLNVVPLRKKDFLLGTWFIALIINLVSNILLLLFMKYLLQLDLIRDPLKTLAVLLFANILGTVLGLFIGGFSRISYGAKNGLVIGLTLLMSFAAGMMSPDIKILIEDRMPLLNALNPVSIVTTQLYRINYLDAVDTLPAALAILAAMALALALGSIALLRRKTYDTL